MLGKMFFGELFRSIVNAAERINTNFNFYKLFFLLLSVSISACQSDEKTDLKDEMLGHDSVTVDITLSKVDSIYNALLNIESITDSSSKVRLLQNLESKNAEILKHDSLSRIAWYNQMRIDYSLNRDFNFRLKRMRVYMRFFSDDLTFKLSVLQYMKNDGGCMNINQEIDKLDHEFQEAFKIKKDSIDLIIGYSIFLKSFKNIQLAINFLDSTESENSNEIIEFQREQLTEEAKTKGS